MDASPQGISIWARFASLPIQVESHMLLAQCCDQLDDDLDLIYIQVIAECHEHGAYFMEASPFFQD